MSFPRYSDNDSSLYLSLNAFNLLVRIVSYTFRAKYMKLWIETASASLPCGPHPWETIFLEHSFDHRSQQHPYSAWRSQVSHLVELSAAKVSVTQRKNEGAKGWRHARSSPFCRSLSACAQQKSMEHSFSAASRHKSLFWLMRQGAVPLCSYYALFLYSGLNIILCHSNQMCNERIPPW